MTKEKSLFEQMQEFAAQAKPLPPQTKEEEVSVQTLDNLVKEMFELSKQIEAAESIVSAMNKNLATLKHRSVGYLKALNRKDYGSAYGSISVQAKWRVNMPQSDADKAAFFDYLRGKGVFDQYATVHYQALNAFYMAEWDAAKERGDGVGFTLPGVGEPKLFEDLRMTKPRKKVGTHD